MSGVDRNSLIISICASSGLDGAALETLQSKLSKMNDSELTKLIAGGAKSLNGKGIELEKTVPYSQPATSQKPKLSEEQSKNISIESIEENIKSAEIILKNQDLGIVSKGYDALKYKNIIGNQDISTDNVKEVIQNQKQGVQFLKYAKDGAISKKDYYLKNVERLKTMIIRRLYVKDQNSGNDFLDRNKGNYTKAEFAKFVEDYINKHIDNLKNLESIKSIQHSLIIQDNAKDQEFLNNLLNSANKEKNTPKTKSIEGQNIKIKSGSVPIEFDTDEAIKFEEVYKYERGVAYSKESIERLFNAKSEMSYVTGAYNKMQQFNTMADSLLEDESSSMERANSLRQIYQKFYQISPDGGHSELKKLITNSKLPIQLDKNGIDLSAYADETKKQKALDSLIKLAKQDRQKDLDTILNGKGIEYYQSNYETSHAVSMGLDNAEELSSAMRDDNMSAIQRYAGGTAMGGVVLLGVGGVLTAIPVTSPVGVALMGIGQATAMTGMAARNILGFTDALTRNDVSSDELKELSKDLAMDVGGFIIGGAAGRKGIQAGEKIFAESGDKVVKFIAEKGTDFTLSLAGDLAMMGVLNTSDTSGSLTQGNLMGICVSTITGISTAKYQHLKGSKNQVNVKKEFDSPNADSKTYESVAPFAERVLKGPQIGDVVPFDRSKIEIENGKFNSDGEFIPDGTFTRTEKQPFAEQSTYKRYPDGNVYVAKNIQELHAQIGSLRGQKLEKYEMGGINELVAKNPELTVADFSEIIADVNFSTGKRSFSTDYDGLKRVKDFKTFKTNINEFSNFMKDMIDNDADSYVVKQLQTMRNDYFTEPMSLIKPEDYKRNLDYFKSLDSSLQRSLIKYDNDVLFEVHDDKYFERVSIADEYNKFVNSQEDCEIRRIPKIGEDAKRYTRYSEEKIVQLKQNIELAKELITAKSDDIGLIGNIIGDDTGRYIELSKILKSELPENAYGVNLMSRLSDAYYWGSANSVKAPIELIKVFPNDVDKLPLYMLTDNFANANEKSKQEILNKIKILEKVPQLAKYNDKVEKNYIEHFLDKNIENSDKIVEFMEFAEPEYLSYISIDYDSRMSFDKIFQNAPLDNMAANAKSYNELPKEFREYLVSDKSIRWNNRWDKSSFNYETDPKEFQSNVETINKYKDKLGNYELESIYNGNLKAEDNVLDVLSSIDPRLSKNIVNYKRANDLNGIDKETLDKFVKYVNDSKDLSEGNLNSFASKISKDFMGIFEKLSSEELDALSFNLLANLNSDYRLDIDNWKKNINFVPKKLRNIIKEDAKMIYLDSYTYDTKKQRYCDTLNYLDKISEEDLKSIGSKSLTKFISSECNNYDEFKPFNEKNLELWREIPQDVKDKLGENSYYLLTSDAEIKPDILKTRTEYLKNNNVFENTDEGPYYVFLENTSKEMDDILDVVLKDKSFDKRNFNSWVFNLGHIKNKENPDFNIVKELLNNDKIGVNEILPINSALSNHKNIAEFQMNFARDLIERDDVDNSIILNLLYCISTGKYNELTKEYDVADISKLRADFVNSVINSKRFDKTEIEKLFSAIGDRSNVSVEKEKIEFAKYLVNEKSVEPNQVSDILQKIKSEPETLPIVQSLVKDLIANKDFENSNISSVVAGIQSNAGIAEKQIGLVKDLIANKDFDNSNISSVVNVISSNPNFVDKQIEFALALSKDKEIPKNDICSIIKTYVTDNKHMTLIDNLYKNKDIPNKCLKDIATYLSANKNNIENAEEMFATPELTKWAGKNLENGIGVEVLYNLSRTQKKLYDESQKIKDKSKTETPLLEEAKASVVQEAKPAEIVKAEEALVNVGVHPKMAPNYVKMCQENGIVDKVKLDAVCALAQVEVPVNEIKNIFNLATGSPLSSANGQFRPDVIKDIISFKQSGIDDVKLSANLAAVKNMSIPELKSRINTKVREDLIKRIDELSYDIKQKIKSKNINLDAISAKAQAEPKAGKVRQSDVDKIQLRSLDNIVGVEKIIINKYKHEVDQSIWGDGARFKVWAEEKLNKVLDFEQNPNYIAAGDYAKFNDARKQGVESWYKYLKEESNYKDDVFVQLLVMDGITKEMRPNNANTPPAVSHGSFEATYNALLEDNSTVSFSKIYARQTKLNAIKQFGKKEVSMDGIEGQWVSIPRTQKGEPGYDEHVAMVQSLSEGSSWCLRFENAHSYLQYGNLHFFVDKNGNSQTAINETNGEITQIQKRYDQDSTVPIPYSKVIDAWAKENKYTGFETQIKTALDAKPKFDELRDKLAGFEADNDCLSIFKELNMNAVEALDGTYELNSYNPKITKHYTLFDLGVNENKLMQNVSQIKVNLNLDGSSVTTLPNLRVVGGDIIFGDNKISDLRALEKIHGKNLVWDK